MHAMATAAFIVIAYLIGSLSFAVIVSKAFGLPDPKSYGSGNPGATNVLRSGNKAAAILTLLGDALKGFVAVILARWLGPQFGVGAAGVDAVALAVFAGHLYPVFFGFKGGKGVATAAGVLFAMNPWLGLASMFTWLLFAVLFRYSSLAALAAAVASPVFAAVLSGRPLAVATVSAIALLLIWRHRENIRKLFAGTESRIGRKKQGGAQE
jgi:acyl phosphate:glycerol-3-phosphate acyltransferase